MTYYHVTPLQHIRSIQQHGLIPKIGPLSKSANELKPAIYLFTTEDDMTDAISNWLYDAICDHYGDDCEIAILHIHLPKSIIVEKSTAEYEYICRETIPAKYIRFYTDDGRPINQNPQKGDNTYYG